MRILSNVLIINCLSILFLNAQTENNLKQTSSTIENSRFFVGIDLGRSLGTIGNGGYSLDGEFRYWVDNTFMFSMEGGYTDFRQRHQRAEIKNYRNQGWYIKPGVEIFPSQNWQKQKIGVSIGIAAILSSYKELGDIFYQGEYFEDTYVPFKRGSFTNYAFEFNLNFWGKLLPNFYVVPSIRADVAAAPNLSNSSFSNFPIYYLSGVGINYAQRPNALIVTGGFNIRLLYGFH